MSDSGETRTQRVRRNVIAGTVAGVFVVGAAIGVPVAVNASNTAHTLEVQATQQAQAASVVVKADASRDAVLAGSAVQAGVIAQQEAAAKAAAALAAQQAAAVAAAKAAAQATAQQQAAVQQASDQSSSNGSGGASSSGEPAGTPLPMTKVTDPNNAQYGQMVPAVDPGSWCASHSASTVNGVPTCD